LVSSVALPPSLKLRRAGRATANSGRDSEFFIAFYDMAGHNFVGRSGILYIDENCYMGGVRAEKIPSMEERKKIEETLKEQKEAQAKTTTDIEQPTICVNCEEKIDTLEKRYTFEGHVVCAKCYEKLNKAL